MWTDDSSLIMTPLRLNPVSCLWMQLSSNKVESYHCEVSTRANFHVFIRVENGFASHTARISPMLSGISPVHLVQLNLRPGVLHLMPWTMARSIMETPQLLLVEVQREVKTSPRNGPWDFRQTNV